MKAFCLNIQGETKLKTKPILSLILVIVMLFSVTSCKNSSETGDTGSSPETNTTSPESYETGIYSDEPVDLLDQEDSGTEEENMETFYIEPIPDDVFEYMQGKSYKDGCPVPRDELRLLHVTYKDIDGDPHEGTIVCNKIISESLLEIFYTLYYEDYPIEKICLVDDYGGDDELSMEDNNSSCFNYRTIAGTDIISKHGLGIAVDINPRYNPYISDVPGAEEITPLNGVEYADRDKDFDYKIEKGDLCYELFTSYGFEWGGDWEGAKDYQHFELSDEVAERLNEEYAAGN